MSVAKFTRQPGNNGDTSRFLYHLSRLGAFQIDFTTDRAAHKKSPNIIIHPLPKNSAVHIAKQATKKTHIAITEVGRDKLLVSLIDLTMVPASVLAGGGILDEVPLTSLCLISILAFIYIFIGATIMHFAEGQHSASTNMFGKYCWLIQECLDLPFKLCGMLVRSVHGGLYRALFEAARWYASTSELSQERAEARIALGVMSIAAVCFTSWMAATFYIKLAMVSITLPVPYIAI